MKKLIIALILFILVGCAPTEEQIALTATANYSTILSKTAEYAATSTADKAFSIARTAEIDAIATNQREIMLQATVITSTPKPWSSPTSTNITDKRTNFQKCEQTGEGIRYVINGNNVSGVSLTWQNDTGGTNQGDYKVPFCSIFNNFKSGDFVYISAQIIEPTSGAGSITCRIYQGSYVLSEAKASGFPSIATCSGSVN